VQLIRLFLVLLHLIVLLGNRLLVIGDRLLDPNMDLERIEVAIGRLILKFLRVV